MSESSLYKRTIIRHEVPSRHLAEGVRSLRVYLPPGYDESRRYSAVYCQDGEDFFNFGRIATIAQKLILEQNWEPFVIVGVDVDKAHRTAEYMPGGERHEAYVRFFNDEMVPFVEARTSLRQAAEDRLLAGDSLGGAVSLSIALDRPDRFSRILSLSGAFYDGSIAQIQAAKDLSSLSLWMVVGLQEHAYETDHGRFNFVQLNRMARKLLEARGAYVDYREKDGEHKWGFWQGELPEALGAFLGPDAHM
ncbi:alpha/beta hydrolase [Cohnella zeiphila]|uniref:Esterase family protein n=1 Tax=Cohnella zeiphila TaxID=2761120 RepID=A0A7X0VVW6_9BACL|nr:alpha/beta hydrolase-fold protein [Cohnella zeiphila]MBB6730328.1 esterase family protein [Cohnella zeiphila]